MWIKDVSLDDFGCFHRARIDGLQNGVNVIVGPQRAGKTTFMEAVRHLGYGIPRDGSVPPPTDQYSLGATVETADGESRIDIEGYGNPTVSTLRGPEQSIAELYGNLRKEQYYQLYTISLDELRQSPRSLDEDISLAEVLLGGGFGDAVKLPRYRDEFGDAAGSIGGKHGRASYDLKGPLQTISEGVEAREEAIDQVDEYGRVAANVEAHTERLESIESDRSALENEQTLLETIQAQYDAYRSYCRLESTLADVDDSRLETFPLDRVETVRSLVDDYAEARTDLDKSRREFKRISNGSDIDSHLALLQNRYDDIQTRRTELSGLRERHVQVRDEKTDLDATWQSLEDRAAELNDEWDGKLDPVRGIDTDAVARDEVDRVTSSYADAVQELEREQSSLESARDRRTALGEELEEARAESGSGGTVPITTVAIGAVLALLLGIGAAVAVTPIAGVVVTFLVLTATGAVAYGDVGPVNEEASAVQALKADLRSASASVDEKSAAVERARSELTDAEAEYHDLCRSLGLPGDVSPETVSRFYADVRALQSDIAAAETRQEEYESDVAVLRADLEDCLTLLENFPVAPDAVDDPIADAPQVFGGLERAGEHAEAAIEVEHAQNTVDQYRSDLEAELDAWDDGYTWETLSPDELEAQAVTFLEEADEVQKSLDQCAERDRLRAQLERVFSQTTVASALAAVLSKSRGGDADVEDIDQAIDGDTVRDLDADTVRDLDDDTVRDLDDDTVLDIDGDTVLKDVTTVIDEYGNLASIETRLTAIEDELEELWSESEELRDERASMDNRLETLRSADDVHAAHETIQRGRRELEPLAEEYATNRLAEYFLDELYEQYIDRTTGPLLERASGIFETITDGEYQRIDTTDELADLDFTTLLAEGGTQAPGELSRATVEQLFLSVRLARIQLVEQPLPVLLDDSFTNFDPEHRRRTLQIVEELAGTNQVFLLTCHPELVDAVEGATVDVSYWQVDDGQFEGPVSATRSKQVLHPQE